MGKRNEIRREKGRWVGGDEKWGGRRARKEEMGGEGTPEVDMREGEKKMKSIRRQGAKTMRLTGRKQEKREGKKERENTKERNIGKDWGRSRQLGERNGEVPWRRIPGFPQWCQGSGVTCWPQNRPWTPLPEHLALYLAVLALAILPTEELQPAPERLGAHPSWTNPSFHAPQPLWLGLTISAASALGLWHDLGSSRHH